MDVGALVTAVRTGVFVSLSFSKKISIVTFNDIIL